MPPKKRAHVVWNEHDPTTWFANEQVRQLPYLADKHFNDRNLELPRVEDEIFRNFEGNIKWKFEKVIDAGNFGMTAIVRYKRTRFDRADRRFVIKRSISIEGDAQMKNEIQWYNRLRGAEHIAKLIVSDDDPVPSAAAYEAAAADPQSSITVDDAASAIAAEEAAASRAKGSLLDRMFTRSRKLRKREDPKRIFDEMELKKFAGWPVLILEYLPNGTLGRLVDRAVRDNTAIPNRLLWYIYLCLVRACVAMAYPPGEQAGSQTVLETVPMHRFTPLELAHRSLHLGNIAFAAADSRFSEHNYAPAAKFIDLGVAAELPVGWGIRTNLEDVAIIMICLITKTRTPNIHIQTQYNDTVTLASDIVPPNDKNYPLLDPELMDLIARSRNVNLLECPSLEATLTTIENAVKNKTAASFTSQRAPFETDAYIKDFVQRMVFNADVEPNDGLEGPAPQDEHVGPPLRSQFRGPRQSDGAAPIDRGIFGPDFADELFLTI